MEKKLIKNTFAFAVSDILCRILQLILIPVYTFFLTTQEYGIIDLFVNYGGLIAIIFSLGIYEATLRLVMDREINKEKVLFNSLFVIIILTFGLVACFPLLKIINNSDGLDKYLFVMIIYSFFRELRTNLMSYAKGIGKTNLFAIVGVINTASFLLMNILFLVVFNFGIDGYIASLVISELIVIIILCICLSTKSLYSFKNFDWKLLKKMLYYSLPLMFNALCWWIVNISDRFMVTEYIGEANNGIYSFSNKIPALLTTVYSIFAQAWQIFTIEKNNNGDDSYYQRKMFSILVFFLGVSSSCIILLIKYYIKYLADSQYLESYNYVAILTFSQFFYCLSLFTGNIYVVIKKTNGAVISTFIASIINVLINIFLIPKIGIYAACLSTFISFLFIYLYRLIDTKKFRNYNYYYFDSFMTTIILMIQVLLAYLFDYMLIINICCVLMILIINIHNIRYLFEYAIKFFRRAK